MEHGLGERNEKNRRAFVAVVVAGGAGEAWPGRPGGHYRERRSQFHREQERRLGYAAGQARPGQAKLGLCV